MRGRTATQAACHRRVLLDILRTSFTTDSVEGSAIGKLPGAVLVVSLLVVFALAGCTGGDPEEERHPAMEELKDGWMIEITLMGGDTETRHVFPSEWGHDYDRDGQDDLQEYMQGTDPNDPDSSGNGLLDGENIALGPEEHPAADWIERGIAYRELDDGRLEFQGSFPWKVDPAVQDHDGDGILDGQEVGGLDVWILGEARRVTTDPAEYDTSGDGMGDGRKRDMGLDPSSKDTNGDGVPDRSSVNPWVDLRVQLEVDTLDIARAQDQVTFDLQFSQQSWQLRVDEGGGFSSDPLEVTSTGGDITRGRHNTTFALTAMPEDGDTDPVDLFSHTTGSTSLIGSLHGLTGDLYVGQNDGREPWPEDATFEGDDGQVTLRLVPVWPDDWQRCIDEGCRHGDGDFEWR